MGLTARALSLLQIVGAPGPLRLDGEDRSRAFADGALLLPAGWHVLQLGEGEAQRDWILHLAPRSAQRLDLRPRPRPPRQPALKREGSRELDGVAEIRDEDLHGALGSTGDRAARERVRQLIDYGLYLLARGQAAQAEPYFTQALAQDPQSPGAHRGIIATAVVRGNEKLALGQMSSMLNLQTTLHDGELLRQVFGGARASKRCAQALQAEADSAP